MSDGLAIDVGGYDLNIRYGATIWAPYSEFASDGVYSESGSQAAIDRSALNGALKAYDSSSIVCNNCIDSGLTSIYSRYGSSVQAHMPGASISTAATSASSSIYSSETKLTDYPSISANSSGIFKFSVYNFCNYGDDSYCLFQLY
jgi:hypothetical protein